MRFLFIATIVANIAYFASAECPNACNGHGTCTSYDMCVCNRNWQANDCSERTCQFGLAHVDTPKGDLNQDGMISGPDTILVENNEIYPFGTTEQFPRMQDTSLNDLDNSAHYYMECSNKGSCDRKSGECQCFDGYDGAACQRASCPGFPDSCSGHGVCKTIRQLAESDNNNIYELWDKHSTMGCECDAGFFGPDCSLRECKFGIDPLYLDDTATIKYSTFDFAVLHTEPNGYDSAGDHNIFSNGMRDNDDVGNDGYWAIRFFDAHGEDWLTNPIVARASCDEVIDALNALPNDVIPEMDYSLCTRTHRNGIDPLSSGPHAIDSGDPRHDSAQWSGWSSGSDAYFTGSSTAPYAEHGFTSGNARPIQYLMGFWLTDNSTDSSYNHHHLGGNTLNNGDRKSLSVNKLSGDVYRVHFFNNPGHLKEPMIETYLDGARPTLFSVDSNSYLPAGHLITAVWTDGQQGENFDYIADHCDGVQFTISNTYIDEQGTYLNNLNPDEMKLLKTCLGESDFDFGNNMDVYEWDHGNVNYPHLVKLVRTVTTSDDGGYYAALIFENGRFRLLNEMHASDDVNSTHASINNTDAYEIYTTKGVLARVSASATAVFGFGSKEIYSVNYDFELDKDPAAISKPVTSGDVSCELTGKRPSMQDPTTHKFYNAGILNASITGRPNGAPNLDMFWYDTRLPENRLPFANEDAVFTSDEPTNIYHCLNKGSLFTVFNFYNSSQNPPHINMYTAEKLYQKQYKYSAADKKLASVTDDSEGSDLDYETFTVVTDLSTNWANGRSMQTEDAWDPTDGLAKDGSGGFQFYKFYPARESTYNYVAQCSNRGICKEDTGLCDCFSGYTSDSCSEQNSLAV